MDMHCNAFFLPMSLILQISEDPAEQFPGFFLPPVVFSSLVFSSFSLIFYFTKFLSQLWLSLYPSTPTHTFGSQKSLSSCTPLHLPQVGDKILPSSQQSKREGLIQMTRKNAEIRVPRPLPQHCPQHLLSSSSPDLAEKGSPSPLILVKPQNPPCCASGGKGAAAKPALGKCHLE